MAKKKRKAAKKKKAAPKRKKAVKKKKKAVKKKKKAKKGKAARNLLSRRDPEYQRWVALATVSYTHLTLPTILLV